MTSAKSFTKLASLNVQSLNSAMRLNELTFHASKLKLSALGIQEHRMRCDDSHRTLDCGEGWKLVHNSADQHGGGGVGILHHPKSYAALESVEVISPRVMSFSFTCATKRYNQHWPKVSVIVCYSPTSAEADQNVVDCFYSELQKAVDSVGKLAMLCILGDFNARLPKSCLSPWNFSDDLNANSQIFQDFLQANELFSSNTSFQKSSGKLFTHTMANGYRSQIDHVVFRCKYRNSVHDSQALTFQGFKTDHRIVVCNIRLSIRSPQPVSAAKRPKYNWSEILKEPARSSFVTCVSNHFSVLQNASVSDDHCTRYSKFVDAVRDSVGSVLPPVSFSQRAAAWRGCNIAEKRAAVFTARRQHKLLKSKESAQQYIEASKALGAQYSENKRCQIESLVRDINDADESRKTKEIWKGIDRLSGRKSSASGKIRGSKEERLSGWYKHFRNLFDIANPSLDSDEFVPVKVVDNVLDDIRCGPFDLSEFDSAAKQGKRGKKCGLDDIEQEILLIPEFQEILLPILNDMYSTNIAPSELTTIRMIALPKKGDLSKFNSYRGISLMSVVAKQYNRMLLNRIRGPVDKLLRDNQNGFRQHRGTLEPILALRRLIEEVSRKKDAELFVIFIDFFKAFDSVNRKRMFAILSAYGIPDETISAIKCMYDNSKAFVATTDGDTDTFDINVGVLQGDTLAPFLFIIVVDYVLRQALGNCQELGFKLRSKSGSRQPAKFLTDLDFADDIALLASVWDDAQALLTNVESSAAAVNLGINNVKTKALQLRKLASESSPEATFKVRLGSVDNVDDFCYLGSYVRDCEKDLSQRIGQAWAAASKLWKVWKADDLDRPLKRNLFRATIESVLLYGSSCWALTRLQTKRLDGTYTRLLRKALNIPWAQHITNKELYGNLKQPSITVSARRIMFAGHCFRRTDQPVHDLVLFEANGTFRPGQHSRMSFVKQLKSDLAQNSASEVGHILSDEQLLANRVCARSAAAKATVLSSSLQKAAATASRSARCSARRELRDKGEMEVLSV